MATTKRKRALKSPKWRLWQVKIGRDDANVGKPIKAVSERQAIHVLVNVRGFPYSDRYFAVVVGKPRGLPKKASPTERAFPRLPSASVLAARNPHHCATCGYYDHAMADDCPGCGAERVAA
ncbi:MAG: hypothetical protein AAB444_00020 [Patescibacteria group bacterium]